MDEIRAFLRDAAALAGVESRDVLARVLHVGDDALEAVIASMDRATRALTVSLDRELRIRNPGLHYVERKMFLGYRREGISLSPVGKRSQIFVSLLRNNTRLDVVLPVDGNSIGSIPNAHILTGKGHHGVGDVRVSIKNEAEVQEFLRDFDDWLSAPPNR